jgi:hypothetical protein
MSSGITRTRGSRLRPQRPPKPSPQIADRVPERTGIQTPCQLLNSYQRMMIIVTMLAIITQSIGIFIRRKYA